MKFIAIIPARYASSRFPGKPLANMAGKTMIQRVYEQVEKVIEEVWVATDDERIYNAVEAFGGKVIMTSTKHNSGTDRLNEAYNKIGKSFDVIINVQGDEPFISTQQIEILKGCFDNKEVQLATLVKAFEKDDTFETLSNPNSPKVVINKANEAIYFSRSVVPYLRDKDKNEWSSNNIFYKHIGMYGYRSDVLSAITQLPQSTLEKAESLEQLRWIENGYSIRVGYTDQETIGIDTPEDLELALRKLNI